jgi:hypothetical protein
MCSIVFQWDSTNPLADCNNLGLAINKILSKGGTKKFQITIAVKAMCKGFSGHTEFPNCQDDIRQRKQPETKSPVKMGGRGNKNQSTAVPADTNTVPKHNVHMNSVKVFVLCFVEETTTLGFQDGSIGSKRGGEFTTVNPLPILTDLQKMFVVTEFTAAHDPMQLLRQPMSLCIGAISGVAWLNRRKRPIVMMKKPSDLLGRHRRKKTSCRPIVRVKWSVNRTDSDSHYGQTKVSQVMETANTTNKCRPGAHRAPIKSLGIDYHQYCSSSYLDHIEEAVVPPAAHGNGNQA